MDIRVLCDILEKIRDSSSAKKVMVSVEDGYDHNLEYCAINSVETDLGGFVSIRVTYKE